MTRRAARAAIFALLLVVDVGASARAQTTTLTITGNSTTTFAQPTLANYVAGYIDGTTLPFTVTLAGGPTSKTHTVTVEVCATTATLGSGKGVSKLMWQPSDASLPWQSMTQGCTGPVQVARTVTTVVMAKGDSFSLGVKLRMMLDWTDTASSYGTTIQMTVNLTTP